MYVHVQNFLSQTTLYQIKSNFFVCWISGDICQNACFLFPCLDFFYNLDGRFLKNRDINSLVIPLFLWVYLGGGFLGICISALIGCRLCRGGAPSAWNIQYSAGTKFIE